MNVAGAEGWKPRTCQDAQVQPDGTTLVQLTMRDTPSLGNGPIRVASIAGGGGAAVVEAVPLLAETGLFVAASAHTALTLY